MARYCFYCGRALAPGEKCTCREDSKKKPNQSSSTSSAGPSFSGSKNTKSANTASSNRNSWFEGFRQRKQKASEPNRSSKKAHTVKTGRSAFKKPDRAALFAGLQQFMRYFTKPADTVRQSIQFSDKRKAFILLGIEALMGGFLLMGVSGQKYITSLFQLTIVQTNLHNPVISKLFLFAQGISMVISLHLVLTALLYLTIKIAARQTVDFIRLLTAISPISFYSALFMLLSLSALPGSMFYAIMLLIAGFGASTLVTHMTFKHLCQLDDNRTFGLTVVLMTAYAAVISLLISQIAPVLTTLFDMQLSL